MSKKARAVFEAMAGTVYSRCTVCNQDVRLGCEHTQQWTVFIQNSIRGPVVHYVRRKGGKRLTDPLLWPDYLKEYLFLKKTRIDNRVMDLLWEDVEDFYLGGDTIQITTPSAISRLVTFVVDRTAMRVTTVRNLHGKKRKK